MPQGDNKCVSCGQFAGRGHRCPPATDLVTTNPLPPIITASSAQQDVANRVHRAQGAVTLHSTTSVHALCADMGYPNADGEQAYLTQYPAVRESLGENADILVDPMEAGAYIRDIARHLPARANADTPSVLTGSLMLAAETGRARFSHAQLATLATIPDTLLQQRFNPDTNASLDAEDAWEPTYVQRNCKECGQFIGRRSEHLTCTQFQRVWLEKRDDEVYGRHYRHLPGWMVKPRTREFTPDPETDYASLPGWPDSTEHLGATTILRDLRQRGTASSGYTAFIEQDDEELADTYFALPRTGAGATARTGIIFERTRTTRLRKRVFLDLPDEIQNGIIDNPNLATQSSLFLIAQYSKEDLTPADLHRMLTTGRDHAAQPLLLATRTRERVSGMLDTTPSLKPLQHHMATRGYLPDSDVIQLASSPDPADRAAAAAAPNLPLIERQRLATDTPEVAQAMATQDVLRNYPEIGRQLLRHPDESVRKRTCQAASSSSDPILQSEAREVYDAFFYPDRLAKRRAFEAEARQLQTDAADALASEEARVAALRSERQRTYEQARSLNEENITYGPSDTPF